MAHSPEGGGGGRDYSAEQAVSPQQVGQPYQAGQLFLIYETFLLAGPSQS